MKKLITTITMIMLLFFAVGCGEGGSTANGSFEEGDYAGVTIKVSMNNKKNKNIMYQANKCLNIAKVQLFYRISSGNDNGVWMKNNLITGVNGLFTFTNVSLSLNQKYDFKADAYNTASLETDGTIKATATPIATAQLNSIAIATNQIINMILKSTENGICQLNPLIVTGITHLPDNGIKVELSEDVDTCTMGGENLTSESESPNKIWTIQELSCNSTDPYTLTCIKHPIKDEEGKIVNKEIIIPCPNDDSGNDSGSTNVTVNVYEFYISGIDINDRRKDSQKEFDFRINIVPTPAPSFIEKYIYSCSIENPNDSNNPTSIPFNTTNPLWHFTVKGYNQENITCKATAILKTSSSSPITQKITFKVEKVTVSN